MRVGSLSDSGRAKLSEMPVTTRTHHVVANISNLLGLKS
ncbi:hypothetical protein CKA32_006485 [Geitlerinema sp. FC II]|nr:hypothetical protein CKA32_006485 [Geitlerinema sp. FC II]